jgi:hypothetical protein
MARKNLKLPEDLFMALRDDKDDQQSWPHYFEEQCLHDSDDATPTDPEAIADEFVRAFPYEDLAEQTSEKSADKVVERLR